MRSQRLALKLVEWNHVGHGLLPPTRLVRRHGVRFKCRSGNPRVWALLSIGLYLAGRRPEHVGAITCLTRPSRTSSCRCCCAERPGGLWLAEVVSVRLAPIVQQRLARSP